MRCIGVLLANFWVLDDVGEYVHLKVKGVKVVGTSSALSGQWQEAPVGRMPPASLSEFSKISSISLVWKRNRRRGKNHVCPDILSLAEYLALLLLLYISQGLL